MIDASRSLELAGKIDCQALPPYLEASGWVARPSKVEGWSIFSKGMTGTGDEVELLLPVKRGSSDERRRVADALRVLAAVESTTEDDVAFRVRTLNRAPKLESSGRPLALKPRKTASGRTASLRER